MAAKRKRKRKSPKKRKRAKSLAVTVRVRSSSVPVLRALAKRTKATPRKFLQGVVDKTLELASEPLLIPVLKTPPAAVLTNGKRFAAAIRKAGKARGVTRFHDDRAFIGSIFEHMSRAGQLGTMTADDFKRALIKLHRAGLLRLTRADLVGAMPRAEVDRSEARFQDATFHFVALD